MSNYSLRPSNQQKDYRQMAQTVDAIVTQRVARFRDRCKPPIAEDIYDEIILLMEEKMESGKVASLLTVSEKARKYWRTHGREFVDLVELQEQLGRPAKGILLTNGRALLSDSLAEEVILKYVSEHGKDCPQSIQKDMQSLFELPLPLIQHHVKRSINVKVGKDRRYIRQKFEERMNEVRNQTIAEAREKGDAAASLPVLLIRPTPKRKAKPKSHAQKLRDQETRTAYQFPPTLANWQEHPRNLIPELCRQFYHLGWVTGTGGGMSIRLGQEIYVAPSGVQKERIQPEDLFVQDLEERFLAGPPPHKKLRKSECTPLFMNAYTLRGAGAVIHTHSKAAVLATLLCPGPEFRITHQEMIKGIKKGQSGVSYRYDEELVVPIIENVPFERDLKASPFRLARLASATWPWLLYGSHWPWMELAGPGTVESDSRHVLLRPQASMKEAMERYPDTCAVLVRRHGVYVWGDTWERAKSMCECYDYLFDVAVKMRQLGMDPAAAPGGACPVGDPGASSTPATPDAALDQEVAPGQPSTLAEAVQVATAAAEAVGLQPVSGLSALAAGDLAARDQGFPVTLDTNMATEGQTTYVVYM
ncbi:uncharacterized protein LOC8029502 isoform X2 [Ixodes scapularis]|uniref:uncharacterized protein LOC8029502 isoform X2 n=1 Tax=Ixodes scapularis TaxID=6945 RepID=UPI001AD61FC4|nr:uncharacterized protein LOC8029502 isoform X2 [Ixodes scapularis]